MFICSIGGIIMELVRVFCPSCGGELNVQKGSDFIFCNYCGSKFAMPQNFNNKPDISNYLKLGDNAVAVGSYEEAIGFYNKVLEVEPNDYKALIGKAYAYFFTSNLAHPKLFEMESMFEEAYKKTPKEHKESAINEIKSYTLSACQSLFDMAKSHYHEFIGRGDSYNARVFDDFHHIANMVLVTIDAVLVLSSEHRLMNNQLCQLGINVLNSSPTFQASFRISKSQEYQNKINSDNSWLKNQQEKEKRIQQEKYWHEHPDEYRAYLDKLKREKEGLNNAIDKKVNELSKVSEDVKVKVNELRNEREKLGIFAVKRKNQIDSEIAIQEQRLAPLTNEINVMRNKLKNLNNQK